MKKTLFVVSLVILLTACKGKDNDTDTKVQSCMEKDSNPVLVEMRKQANNTHNVSAQYALKATCEELVKNLK